MGASAGPVTARSRAVGGRLTGAVTWTVTVAVAHTPRSKVEQIVYVKVSVPTNPGSGVYRIAPAVTTAVPLAGSDRPCGEPTAPRSFVATGMSTLFPVSTVALSS